jgi:hypothetical protein
MISIKNLLVIIVLTSVKSVMTSTLPPKPNVLTDQHQLLSSTNKTHESEQRHPEPRNLFIKRGLVKHLYQKHIKPNLRFDSDHKSHYSLSNVEIKKR